MFAIERQNVHGLNQLAEQIYQMNKEKGFWDKEINIGEKLMLVTSELAEALEADRKGMNNPNLKNFLKEIDKPLTKEEFQQAFRFNIKDHFQDEIADAIIRLFDLCGGLGINIETHIALKLAYNQTRPNKHGKKY